MSSEATALQRARASLEAADLALFKAATQATSRRRPWLDRALPVLSRAADHSVLWIGVSGVLALTGRPDARRAAARGLVSIALASAVANVPAKLLTMRPRPPIEVVPLSRRAMRVPTSSSFPSGHSASAAAYAVGASLEFPQLALPIGGLAALVAGSRVATGVHYPSDVIAGVAIGVGCALVVARVWRPSQAADRRDCSQERPQTL